jgi:hypothetical protein
LAVTVTDGGTISGNWVTGKVKRASTPRRVIMSEMTSDNTGLLINLSNMFYTF